MKRDWECVRAILLALEELPDSSSRLKASDVPGYAEEVAEYHMLIMHEAGLIKVAFDCEMNLKPNRMSWKGHDLLEQLRTLDQWGLRVKAPEVEIKNVH